MIEKGTYSEINLIISLIKACGKNLRDNGIDQWDESYPSIENIIHDIQTGTLFTYKINGGIIGIVVLNETQDQEYTEINWLTPRNSKNMIVHRLAVLPEHQGLGIARKLMTFAEEFALKNNYDSIRLDTYSQNPRNQQFYLNRGYQELGSLFLKYKKEYPYLCYEMLTKNIKKK